MTNYSIIIPFRDKFEMLKKAILSIPDREDIQIILIYNGSGVFPVHAVPDRTKVKLECLESSSTKGAGHARNRGLEIAKGKFILFLDSDDYFTEDAFDSFDKYLTSDADIIFFRPTSINLRTGRLSKRHIPYSEKLDRFLKSGDEDQIRYRWEGPVCKMYRSQLIFNNGIRFDEIMVSNDAWFSLLAGHNAKKIEADSHTVYVITEGEAGQSLVKTVTPETVFIRFAVAIKINKFLKDNKKNKQRIRLLGFIHTTLRRFGIKETFRFLKYAKDNKASLF